MESERFHAYSLSCNKTGDVRITLTLRRIGDTIVALEKQQVARISVCARACVTLLIQHIKRVHDVMLSPWPLSLRHIVRHYAINGTNSGKKVIEHKMCVLIFSTIYV
jgi:hypothetical protein